MSPTGGAVAATKVGKFVVGDVLGEGSYSVVKRCIHEDTKEQYALKIVSKDKLPTSNLEKQVRKEVKIMQYLRHPCVVTVHDVLMSERNMYIVMELVKGRELFEELTARGRFAENDARRIFQQLVDTVQYCHQKGVYHRDLKPENVLVDVVTLNIKVLDFGMGWINDQEHKNMLDAKNIMHTQVGTPQYMAPELLRPSAEGYRGDQVDVWSLGMILYVLLSGSLPFPGEDIDTVTRLVHSRKKMRYPSFVKKPAKDLLDCMLEKSSEKRATLAEVRNHPWFLINYVPVVQKSYTPPARTTSWQRRDETKNSLPVLDRPDSSLALLRQRSSVSKKKLGRVFRDMIGEAEAATTVKKNQSGKGLISKSSSRTFKHQNSSNRRMSVGSNDGTDGSSRHAHGLSPQPRVERELSRSSRSSAAMVNLELAVYEEDTNGIANDLDMLDLVDSVISEQVVDAPAIIPRNDSPLSPRKYRFGTVGGNAMRKSHSKGRPVRNPRHSIRPAAPSASGLSSVPSFHQNGTVAGGSADLREEDESEEMFLSEEAFERVKSFFVKDTSKMFNELVSMREKRASQDQSGNVDDDGTEEALLLPSEVAKMNVSENKERKHFRILSSRRQSSVSVKDMRSVLESRLRYNSTDSRVTDESNNSNHTSMNGMTSVQSPREQASSSESRGVRRLSSAEKGFDLNEVAQVAVQKKKDSGSRAGQSK
ncbi:CBL-interacting protein kinase 23 [Porphyridium purpureum]|uniref:non-specific serine/threonine protein kinase n=1 Tax=Porphyridium purpureum TaxID=35688 RepID=A0A5J4Z1H9_PORPP|nr:CBL-interacting protein kinase 23 [Porphyridium purpureum]|eukprot:POR1745..scf295_1